MTELAPDGEPEMSLVMPFVVVTSKGGPYDDTAFAAGWAAGEIDRALAAVAGFEVAVDRMVPTALVPQIDLIAMRHGYRCESRRDEEYSDEWSHLRLTPVSGGEPRG